MNQKLTIGEPFLETRIIEDESAFPVKGPAILLNLDTVMNISVGGVFSDSAEESGTISKSTSVCRIFSLPPLQAAQICDTHISCKGKALLVIGADTLDLGDLTTIDCLRRIWKSNYEVTHQESQRGKPYYKSPRTSIDNISMNFVLVSEPGAPSGIHCKHAAPIRELHLQIVGEGCVDLLAEDDPSAVFASLPLASGSTHVPEWNTELVYPWHRYRSVTRSIFMAVEISE